MATQAWILSVEDRKKLIEGAFDGNSAKKGAYSPYSEFPVGAALLSSEGVIFKGASVDNASYGCTICAERTAVVKAVSEGKRSFVGLALVSNANAPISPCGMCRQVLREFCSLDMPILMVPGDYPKHQEVKTGHTEGGVRESTLGELLPYSFGPDDLPPRKP